MVERIDTAEALETALSAQEFLLLKHSGRCSISTRAFQHFETFLAANGETRGGFIDVVADRELARLVAERTGIEHQSPQAILLRDGSAVWHSSHFSITKSALGKALAS